MAKEKPTENSRNPFSRVHRGTARLRSNAQRIVPGVNAHAAVNSIILAARKTEIRYRNGETLPASAERLLADARRKDLKHSAILAGNMTAANVFKPVGGAAAHHIVASGDSRAFPSQELLFGWGIAINDADNGVYLPRFKRSVLQSYPVAAKHSRLHTDIYYLEVYARLVDVEPGPEYSTSGREVLRGIKSELIAGTFPYLREG